MKSALLIHYYFPPMQSGAVWRNYYFSLEFARRFDRVFLITTSNRKFFHAQLESLPGNIEVIESRTMDYRRLLSRFSGENHIAESRKSSRLFQFFVKIQKTLPFHFFLGEGGIWYIYQSYLEGKKLIAKYDISLIYSSFGPYADHLVAYLLKRRNRQAKWVADFRDLLIEPLYKNVYFENIQKKFEYHLLRKADLVTTISEGLKEHLLDYGRPVLSIPRGVHLRDSVEEYFEKFTICYTGSLYRDFRDADFFFSQLSALIKQGVMSAEKMQFYYAGRDGSQFARWLEKYDLIDIYHDLGYVNRSEVMSIQNRSHIQLLLTSSSDTWKGVFTGKVFEYLESGNPVLTLIKGTRDLEFEKLMKSTRAGIVCYDPPLEPGRLGDFLVKQYQSWELTGKPSTSLDQAYIRDHLSWSGMTDELLHMTGL